MVGETEYKRLIESGGRSNGGRGLRGLGKEFGMGEKKGKEYQGQDGGVEGKRVS